MVAEFVNQITEQLAPRLSTMLLRTISACLENNLDDQASLNQLKEVFKKIEASGGFLYKVGEGSIIFYIGFKTKEDLDRFWKAYVSGKLAEDIAQCFITKELERKAGGKLTMQLKFQESEYERGLGILGSFLNLN